MVKKHYRRDGYWRVYHLAHTLELDALVDSIVKLVKENRSPCKAEWTKRMRRGRKPVHSWAKMVCISLLTVILGYTFRDMQNQVPKLNLPWDDEPYPDHTTIWKAYNALEEDYLEEMLERTALLCSA